MALRAGIFTTLDALADDIYGAAILIVLYDYFFFYYDIGI